MTANPLLDNHASYEYQYPPFDLIREEHIREALDTLMAAEKREIDVIAHNTEKPSFENTVLAIEVLQSKLKYVRQILSNLSGANTNSELDKINDEFAGRLASHDNYVLLNEDLFNRFMQVDLTTSQNPEDARLLELYVKNFKEAGAHLSKEAKQQLEELNVKIADLENNLNQLIKKGRSAHQVCFSDVSELAGLPANEIEAAAALAKERLGPESKDYLFDLVSTTTQTLLNRMKNRDARKKIWDLSISRNSMNDEFDTREQYLQLIRLRQQKALILGFETFSDYVTAYQTAGTKKAVQDLLKSLIAPAVRNAESELQRLTEVAKAEDGLEELEPWDWGYYTERLRSSAYSLDMNALPAYLPLPSVLENGLFLAAKNLYGITFKRRKDLPVYHPDCETFDVFDESGDKLAILIIDYFSRPAKNGGAWMTRFSDQHKINGANQRPVISLCLNIQRPKDFSMPPLMEWFDVEHAFHEFGHALHGIFSNVTYPSLCCTDVPIDFVEYPSQVNEIWTTEKEILQSFARHYETKAPLDPEVVEKIKSSDDISAGFDVLEYLQCAYMDFELHSTPLNELPQSGEDLYPKKETEILQTAGLYFKQINPRYHLPYFLHPIGGYGSLYYAYCWSQVLDAHTEHWMRKNGPIDRSRGDLFREYILSKGNCKDPLKQFEALVGEPPDVLYYLKRHHMLN